MENLYNHEMKTASLALTEKTMNFKILNVFIILSCSLTSSTDMNVLTLNYSRLFNQPFENCHSIILLSSLRTVNI